MISARLELIVLVFLALLAVSHTRALPRSSSRLGRRRVGGSNRSGGRQELTVRKFKKPKKPKFGGDDDDDDDFGGDDGGDDDEDVTSEFDTDDDACFPADALVTMANNKGVVTISSLNVGHVVQTVTGQSSTIYALSHADHETMASFQKVTTTRGNLTLTPGHFLYVNSQLRPARSVRKGDALTTAHGTQALVTRVDMVRRRGLFNVHPYAGELIVEGFRVSAFTTALPPVTGHSVMTPLRISFRLLNVNLLSSSISQSFIAHISKPLRSALF